MEFEEDRHQQQQLSPQQQEEKQKIKYVKNKIEQNEENNENNSDNVDEDAMGNISSTQQSNLKLKSKSKNNLSLKKNASFENKEEDKVTEHQTTEHALNTQSNVKNNNHNEEEVTSDYIDFIDFVDKYPLPMRSNSDRVAKSNENGDFYDKESLSSPMLIENAKSISQYNVENNNNNGNINNNDDNVSPGQLPPFNTTFTLHSAYSFIYDETNNEKIQKNDTI